MTHIHSFEFCLFRILSFGISLRLRSSYRPRRSLSWSLSFSPTLSFSVSLSRSLRLCLSLDLSRSLVFSLLLVLVFVLILVRHACDRVMVVTPIGSSLSAFWPLVIREIIAFVHYDHFCADDFIRIQF